MLNLKELHLDQNGVEKIEGGIFEDLGKLEKLSLWANEITVIEKDGLRGLVNLKVLYLYQNGMEKIERGIFEDLGKLETLSLNENKITEIEKEGFRGLANLKVLDLGDNRIQEIDQDAFISFGNQIGLIMLDANVGNPKSFFCKENVRNGFLIYRNGWLLKAEVKTTLESLGYLSNWNEFITEFKKSKVKSFPLVKTISLTFLEISTYLI